MDSVHFFNISLDNLIKNLGENDFYLLNQEFNADLLDLLKQKGFFLMTTRTALKKIKDGLLSKDKFFYALTGSAFSDKNYEHVLNVWKVFKMKL